MMHGYVQLTLSADPREGPRVRVREPGGAVKEYSIVGKLAVEEWQVAAAIKSEDASETVRTIREAMVIDRKLWVMNSRTTAYAYIPRFPNANG